MLNFDIETRSELDVTKVGPVVYFSHPSTEVYCAAMKLDDGPTTIWRETMGTPLIDLLRPHFSGGLAGHNILGFELHWLMLKQGIDVSGIKITDSAALSRHANLPGGLDDAGSFFGKPKDADGHRIMMKLSKPRRTSAGNQDPFWRYDTKPDDFAAVERYCARDVEISAMLIEKLPPLSPIEQELLDATQEMLLRGVKVDRSSAELMRKVVKDEQKSMSDAIRKKHGLTLGQTAKIAEHLGHEALEVPHGGDAVGAVVARRCMPGRSEHLPVTSECHLRDGAAIREVLDREHAAKNRGDVASVSRH